MAQNPKALENQKSIATQFRITSSILLGLIIALIVLVDSLAILPLFVVLLAGLLSFIIIQNIFLNKMVFRPFKNTVQEFNQRENILSAANQSADLLLMAGNEKNFDISVYKSMELIGGCLNCDRVHVWRNETIDGELFFVHQNEWLNKRGNQNPIPHGTKNSYTNRPDWLATLSTGGVINGPVSKMTQSNQEIFKNNNIKSILIVPLFLNYQYWGLFSIDDCQEERTFSIDDINILRSVGMMIASSILREKMARELTDSAYELEAALEKTQEADQAKSDFLAQMSHEMRTPLNAIIGLSDIALDGDELGANVRPEIEKVYNAGCTLLSTVNDILDISKVEAGKMELVEVEYEVSSLLNDTITQSVMFIGEKPVDLIFDIDENLPVRLYGDELRIKQVFNNLLSNAFKYTREGSVKLSVSCSIDGETVALPEAEHKIFPFGPSSEGADKVLMTASVEDTGIGIKPENKNSIFENYGQADTRANRKIIGTGLGMPLTKKVVEMMGGLIKVESEYGKGSTFTIQFPQKKVTDTVIGREVVDSLKNFRYTDTKRKKNATIEKIRLDYAHVLVVDDVPTNLDVARGMMKQYGLHIDTMTNGQDAINAVREEKVTYNAIFMDHMMPDMDGMEAAKHIREIGTEYAKTVPIIALTANAVVGNKEKFLSHGFQGFLSKPIEVVKLDAVLREFVCNKELESQFLNSLPQSTQSITEEDKENKLITLSNSVNSAVGSFSIQGLNMDQGIEQFGDQETYFNILRTFAATTADLLEKMTGKINLEAYTIAVHGLKGSCRNIKAETMGSQAEALEKAGRAKDVEFIKANNNALVEATKKLIQDITQMLDTLNKGESKTKKDKPDNAQLMRLLEACDKSDMNGADTVMAELLKFEYESGSELIDWLKTSVENVQFSQVVEKLTPMLV